MFMSVSPRPSPSNEVGTIHGEIACQRNPDRNKQKEKSSFLHQVGHTDIGET